MKIEQLVSIDRYVLVIFYTSSKGYQVAVLTASGKVIQPEGIFYQADAAAAQGRGLIEALSLL